MPIVHSYRHQLREIGAIWTTFEGKKEVFEKISEKKCNKENMF